MLSIPHWKEMLHQYGNALVHDRGFALVLARSGELKIIPDSRFLDSYVPILEWFDPSYLRQAAESACKQQFVRAIGGELALPLVTNAESTDIVRVGEVLMQFRSQVAVELLMLDLPRTRVYHHG
jgi:hypothetical protein